MRLFDYETQQVVNVGDEQLGRALASGRYAAPKGTTIPVVSEAGKAGTVSAEDAYEVLNSGYEFETQQVREKRHIQEKYGDSELEAAGYGALSTVTLGGFDYAANLIGGENLIERIRKTRKANPTATTIGEAAGVILPSILSAGAFTPAALAARGARAAGSGVAKKLAAKGAGKVAKTVLPTLARGAVEGAAFSVGAEITEASLGDTDLTAQRLLMAAGTGALLGGASDVALKGGVRALEIGKDSAAKAVERLYERTTGNKPAKALGRTWAKLSSLFSGGDEKQIRQVLKGRLKATRPTQVIDDAADSLTKAGDELESAMRNVSRDAIGANKLKHLDKIVKRGNEGDVASAALGEVDDFIARTDSMLEQGKDAFGSISDVKKLNRLAKEHRERIMSYVADEASGNAEIFTELDDLKRNVGKVANKLSRRRTLLSSDYSTLNELIGETGDGGVYETLRKTLESEDLWGQAGVAQKQVNAAWTKFLSKENYRNNFFVKMGQEEFRDVYRANDKAFSSFVRNLKSGDGLDYEYLVSQTRNKADLAETIEKHFDLDDALRSEVIKAKDVSKKFLDSLTEAKENVTLINQLNELERIPAAMLLGTAAGGALGYAVGGNEGATIGAIVGTLGSPGQSIRRLAALERLAHGTGRYIKRNLDGVFSGVKRLDLPTAAIASVYARGRDIVGDIEKTKEFASEPELLIERLSKNLSDVSQEAPVLGQAMGQSASTGIFFLAQNAPETRQEGLAVSRKIKPTPTQKQRYRRLQAAVMNPAKIMMDISRGSASAADMDALRSVYPSLYEDIAGNMMEEIAERRGKYIPRRGLRTISRVMGAAADPTTSSEFAIGVAGIHEGQRVQQEDRERRKPSSPGKSITPEQQMTREQARLLRKNS